MKKIFLLTTLLTFTICIGGCSQNNSVEENITNNAAASGTVTPQLHEQNINSTIDDYHVESVNPAFSGKITEQATPSPTITTAPTPTATPEPTTTPEPTPEVPMEYRNALSKAYDYLDYTAFSYSGLIDQLEYEGYSTEACTYAVDNCGADWNAQAAKKAKDYLEYTSFSYSGLIGQLEYEGFTTEQATYAVDNCGADWNEQAALKAQDYLDYTSFSRQGLIDQLIYEGFTAEQAEYGVSAVGY